MTKQNGKRLRAVGYCRTSSDSQKDNTSIPVQKSEIARACEREGWPLVAWYIDESRSGSKIEGREQFQAMMRDAAAGKFDIVVTFDMTRFGRSGRDIINSAWTLSQDFGVHLIDTRGSFDTRDPNRVEMNFMQAGMAEGEKRRFLLRTKRGKIERAKKGQPVTSRLPYGRLWDKKTEEWSIDKDAQRIIAEAAERYIAGESMSALSDEYGFKHVQIHKILTQRSGPIWIQNVRCKELGIDERIETPVPPLLPPETIAAIQQRIAANKTFTHGQIKHHYHLARMIFCDHCGYSMFGQTNHQGLRYYRHAHAHRERCCDRPDGFSSVRADAIEENVIRHLFDTFGNAGAVQRAIEAAIPNLDKLRQERERLERLDEEIGKINAARDTILGLVIDGNVTQEQAAKRLDALKDKQARLQRERDRLESNQSDAPSPEQVDRIAKRLEKRFGHRRYAGAKLGAMKRRINDDFDGMSSDDRRALCETVFSGKTSDGRRMGVYVRWDEDGALRYSIRGHLIESENLVPLDSSRLDVLFGDEGSAATKQKELLCVTNFASHSPAPGRL